MLESCAEPVGETHRKIETRTEVRYWHPDAQHQSALRSTHAMSIDKSARGVH
jgi:hypothetical protein